MWAASIAIACTLIPNPDARGQEASSPETAPVAAPIDQADSIRVEDLVIGEGDMIADGTWPKVHYTVTLPDGTLLQSSRAPGATPFEFFLTETTGEPWVQKLAGLRVGGTRRILLPAIQVFKGNIPSEIDVQPDDLITFDVEAIEVRTWPQIDIIGGFRLRQLRPGNGEKAGYGDWVSFKAKVFAGPEERPGLDSDLIAETPFQIALPTPPGIFTGDTRSMLAMFPYLNMMLYGISPGERRELLIPAKSGLLGASDMLKLGVHIDEKYVIEFECVEVKKGPIIELRNGLTMQDVVVGDGPIVQMRHNIYYRCEGTLSDGSVIESNWSSGDPFVTQMFSDRIIAALRLGLQGMRKGGVRVLKAPSYLAYGEVPIDQFAHVPPNSSVTYKIQVVDIADQ